MCSDSTCGIFACVAISLSLFLFFFSQSTLEIGKVVRLVLVVLEPLPLPFFDFVFHALGLVDLRSEAVKSKWQSFA